MNVTYAYFTATATTTQSESSTAIVRIKFDSTTKEIINSTTVTASTLLLPGDELKISGAVENSGTSPVYAVIKLNIQVRKVGETESETVTSKVYAFSGTKLTEIIGASGSYSATAFTLEAPNANKTNVYTKAFEISHLFDVYTYDNSYKNATVTYTLSAHAIQVAYITDADEATTLLLEKIVNEEQE